MGKVFKYGKTTYIFDGPSAHGSRVDDAAADRSVYRSWSPVGGDGFVAMNDTARTPIVVSMPRD